MSDPNSLGGLDFSKLLSGALGEYVQGNEKMSGALGAFQDQIKNTQTNQANLPALAFAAGLLKPTRTGSFGESVGSAGEGAIGAMQQQRQIDFERQSKILELQAAKQQLLGQQLSTLQPFWQQQMAGSQFDAAVGGGGDPSPAGGNATPEAVGAPSGAGGVPGAMPDTGSILRRAQGLLRLGMVTKNPEAIQAANFLAANDPKLQAQLKGGVAAAEARAKMPYDTAAVDMQPDPNNPGSFLLINKLTGAVQHVGASAIQLPPMASSGMPTTGLPAGGGAASASSGAEASGGNGAAEMPQPSPANDFTPALRPEIKERVAMLPAANQGMVTAILEGRMAPPTGRILADPVMGPLFRQALQVDPQFDEATWTARNKMVTGMADTKNASMGMRVDSAKKLINHTYDLLEAATDLHNEGVGGKLTNAPGNLATNWVGSGTQKGALNRFKQAKEGVGSEYVNMMTGGQGGEGDRNAIKDNLSESDPINGTIGSVGTIVDQMHGQVDPLVDQYNGIMKTNVTPDQFLGKKESQKLAAIKVLAEAQRAGTPLTPVLVKETLAGKGLLTKADAAPSPQAIVDELRRRGVIK